MSQVVPCHHPPRALSTLIVGRRARVVPLLHAAHSRVPWLQLGARPRPAARHGPPLFVGHDPNQATLTNLRALRVTRGLTGKIINGHPLTPQATNAVGVALAPGAHARGGGGSGGQEQSEGLLQ